MPDAPLAPTPLAVSLFDITYHWTQPPDGGSAIEEYRLEMGHQPGALVHLHRYQTHYKCEGLEPGRPYLARVQARNRVGWSPFSPFSDASTCVTAIRTPEVPSPPHPIDGLPDRLQFQLSLPYGYGSPISRIKIQLRQLTAFFTGEWSYERRFRVPEDVEVQRRQVASVGSVESDDLSVGSGSANTNFTHHRSKAPSQRTSSTSISILAKDPTVVRFWVKDLVPDCIYEARVSVENTAGYSEYSILSPRVKTNRLRLAENAIAP